MAKGLNNRKYKIRSSLKIDGGMIYFYFPIDLLKRGDYTIIALYKRNMTLSETILFVDLRVIFSKDNPILVMALTPLFYKIPPFKVEELS